MTIRLDQLQDWRCVSVSSLAVPGARLTTLCFFRIKSFGVGVVVRSENPAFQVGDHLYSGFYRKCSGQSRSLCQPGFVAFAEYSVHTDTEQFSKIDNKYDLPWSVFVGIAGMAGTLLTSVTLCGLTVFLKGQTAYFGWREHSHAKKVSPLVALFF